MSNLTYHTARRRHLRPCDFSGLPIEPGDRYMQWAGECSESWDWRHAKGLAICHEICEKPDGSWFTHSYWDECLEAWLDYKLCLLRALMEELEGYDGDLAQECYQAALDYKAKVRRGEA